MNSSQTIIFDLKYTTYLPNKALNAYQRDKHREERAFYDMSGEDNILKYINTEGKRAGKNTMLEYLKKRDFFETCKSNI